MHALFQCASGGHICRMVRHERLLVYLIQDGWNVKVHNKAHAADLVWLNTQIKQLEGAGRKVIIFTHHSPATDTRANDPRHKNSPISSGFVTDLSSELCWKSKDVKLWAFGHTHYNCDFTDESTGKRVYTNQRGYDSEKAAGYDGDRVLEI